MRTPKINEKVIVKKSSIPQLEGKTVTVKNINWVELTVRIYPRGRVDFKVLDSDIDFLEPEELSLLEKRAIVKRMINLDMIDSKRGDGYFIFINKEIGELNELIKIYPNLDFWRSYIPDFSVNSLSWYFSFDGEDMLKKHYNTFVSKVEFVKKDINIGNQKLGEDVKVQKPKSVLDWLK